MNVRVFTRDGKPLGNEVSAAYFRLLSRVFLGRRHHLGTDLRAFLDLLLEVNWSSTAQPPEASVT